MRGSPVTRRGQGVGLGRRRRDGLAAHRAPGEGDDAVGAEVAAAVLHLEHGPGPPGQPSGGEQLKVVALQGVIHRHRRLRRTPDAPLLQPVQKGQPVTGPGHQIHPQGGDGVGLGLGVAAADRHHRLRVVPAGAADHVAALFVADGGDRTGVDDVYVGLALKGDQGVAPLGEDGLHGLGLVLVDLAA